VSTAISRVNGHAVAEPRFDPVSLAEADAIRARSEAETKARIIEAEGKAKAEQILAIEEAEKQRLANDRARMKAEKEQAAHQAYLAEQAEKEARAKAAKEKADAEAADKAAEEAAQLAEQQRSEQLWKWGARGIYAVGLVIAAPVQFIAFWDEKRPFMVAAPALLEGLALVLACGAAWAVAHRRDVLPYRIGIMLGAAVAATINLWHGLTDPDIGLNAGLIGALASLGGPIVLMAYEHGIAQKADGIPSARERRAAKRAKAREEAARAKAKEEKQAAEAKAVAEKKAAQERADEEQKRRDADRQKAHGEVWDVANALRAARGSAIVTEQIWGEAWYRVTGSKTVGITAEIEAQSRAAAARMKVAVDMPILNDFSQVESQKGPRPTKDPDAPDGRRSNGGTPPRRVPGDTIAYSPIAKKQAVLEQTSATRPTAAAEEQS
jgi:cation transport ATPase